MRKRIVLLGLVPAGLVLIGLIPMISIVDVSGIRWIGAAKPWGVAIGDYNDDGLNDIAISEETALRVTVYKSDFTTIIHQWTGTSSPSGVAIGDYNNDGLNDIAIAYSGANIVTVYMNDLPTPTVLHQFTGLAFPVGVAIGDYNNDGLNDLAIAEWSGDRVTVYKSDYSIIHQWTSPEVDGAEGVAIGDYNNDGLNDIAITEYRINGRVTVYNNDVPTPTVIRQWTGRSNSEGVAIGDYDNDGLNDLAFAEYGGNRVTVYKSDFTTVIQQWTGLSGPYGVAIGDYNNDGLNDLAFAEWTGNRVTAYFQTKPGTVARVAESTIVTLRGTLTDDTGNPIQTGSIRVTLYDTFNTQVWQDTFDDVIDNGRYNIPLGTKTTLMLVKGQIYSVKLEVDADSPTFTTADVTFGDNIPVGDLIKFVAD